MIGNVKGLQDPYRNPETQRGFAEQWGQNPAMVTSFADGSKISFEQTIVANATGFKVLRARHVARRAVRRLAARAAVALRRRARSASSAAIVDYTVGPPFVKIFCLAEHADPEAAPLPRPLQDGRGPLYPFWVPYHLPHFEAPNCDRARRRSSATTSRRRSAVPSVEVCAVAKRDLKAGETLDEYGMFMTYGEAVNADEMSARRATCPRASSRAAGCAATSRRTRS